MIPLAMTLLLAGGLLLLLGVNAPRRVRRGSVRPRTVLSSTAGLLLGAICGLVMTGMPVVAVLAGVAGAATPVMLERRVQVQRRKRRRAQWPVLLDDLTSAVRAGMNLPEALIHAGRNSAFAAEWLVFERQYRRTGDFQRALQSLRLELRDTTFDQVYQALAVTRDVGGTELTTVLRSLATFVRSDLHVHGELEARQSWTINAARMAVAAPWVVLLLLSSRPSTISAYSEPRGALILLGVAVASAIAYALMLRIARLDRA